MALKKKARFYRRLIAGICRKCGCTEEHACIIKAGNQLFGCSWIDAARTKCSACYWNNGHEKR